MEIVERVCNRCRKPYTNPYPPTKNPGGVIEIATTEFCADCNAHVMHVLFRQNSAYRSPKIMETGPAGKKERASSKDIRGLGGGAVQLRNGQHYLEYMSQASLPPAQRTNYPR